MKIIIFAGILLFIAGAAPVISSHPDNEKCCFAESFQVQILNKMIPQNNANISREGKSGISSENERSGTLLKNEDPVLRIGLIADIHYADKPRWNNRNYRLSPDKAREAISKFNDSNTDFIVLLGDNIDEMEKEADLNHLKFIDKIINQFNGEVHYVLGNHDLGELAKKEFINNTSGKGEAPNYSFSKEDYHFIVLDANFRQDGVAYSGGNFEWTDSYIPSSQLNWLSGELEKSRTEDRNVIIFIHQILTDENDPHGVKNASAIRNMLEQSGNVLAVFQGHNHHGSYEKINDIHYVGIHPMVVDDTNAFSELIIGREGEIEIIGYGRQPDITLR